MANTSEACHPKAKGGTQANAAQDEAQQNPFTDYVLKTLARSSR